MAGPILALNVLFYVLSDTAYAVFTGCLLAIYWLNRAKSGSVPATEAFGARNLSPHFLNRACLACMAGCMAGLIPGQIVRPWFAAASMSGSDSFTGNLALVTDILSSTHSGKVWYVGSLALVALLAAMLVAWRRMTAPAGAAMVASLLLIGCAKAASGHASGEGDFTVAEFSMLLHLAGTAVWAGAIVVSGLLVIPRLAKLGDPADLWGYARLLSKTAGWALLVIAISGIYNSDRELNGSLSGLWRSDWGKILIAKIAFVLLALVLGAITRFKCVLRPAASQTAELMVRLMRAEALVMIVILCLSGLLANTSPAAAETGAASLHKIQCIWRLSARSHLHTTHSASAAHSSHGAAAGG